MQHSDNTYSNANRTDLRQDERTMAMLVYLLGLFTHIVGPLIIWGVNRSNSKFVDRVGKDYLNFYICYFIWSLVLLVPGYILLVVGASLNTVLGNIIAWIGFILLLLLIVISIMWLVCTIIGCVKSYKGKTYLPLLTIRMIK